MTVTCDIKAAVVNASVINVFIHNCFGRIVIFWCSICGKLCRSDTIVSDETTFGPLQPSGYTRNWFEVGALDKRGTDVASLLGITTTTVGPRAQSSLRGARYIFMMWRLVESKKVDKSP